MYLLDSSSKIGEAGSSCFEYTKSDYAVEIAINLSDYEYSLIQKKRATNLKTSYGLISTEEALTTTGLKTGLNHCWYPG